MENNYWRFTAWVLAALIFVAIGYGIGFSNGFSHGVQFAVHVGLDFVDINIDEERMMQLITLYQLYCGKDGVAQCLEDLRINQTEVRV